eukprot:140260-Hanusia_phi.AAC.1
MSQWPGSAWTELRLSHGTVHGHGWPRRFLGGLARLRELTEHPTAGQSDDLNPNQWHWAAASLNEVLPDY